MTYARIVGTGGYLPKKVVSNKDLEADELTWLRGFWDVINVQFDGDIVDEIDD